MMKSLIITLLAGVLCFASYSVLAKSDHAASKQHSASIKPIDVFVGHARIVNVPKVLLAVGHICKPFVRLT